MSDFNHVAREDLDRLLDLTRRWRADIEAAKLQEKKIGFESTVEIFRADGRISRGGVTDQKVHR